MALLPGSSGAPLHTGTDTRPVNLPVLVPLKRKDRDDDDDGEEEEDDYHNERRQLKRLRHEIRQTKTQSGNRVGNAVTGRNSVNFTAARRRLRDLQAFNCLDDLFAFAPDDTFDVAREIVDNYYNSVSCFKNDDFTWDTPAGMAFMGRIGLFIIPVLRGDPRPPSPLNKYVLPGPHDTKIMVKFTPGLIYGNDHREHMDIKLFTTKHNTDPSKLHDSGELARDFVLMRRRAANGNDESGKGDELCFASLNFVGTSKSYQYKNPCYMSVLDVQTYPRRCPWMDLGRLAGPIDYMTLNDILHEASTRLAAPTLKKIFEFAPAGFEVPPSSSSPTPTPSQKSLGPSAVPSQDQGLDTVVSKVTDLPLTTDTSVDANIIQTRTLPVDTNTEPVLATYNTAIRRLPQNISDFTFTEYFRNKRLTLAEVEDLQRHEAINSKKA
jgi:hypothetical protein